MSQPPSNPYPGSYPPPQQQPGGYQPPQQPQYGGGYPPAPQQPGDYPAAGQPGFGTPAEPPKKKSNVGKILLIVLAVVVVLCVGGGAAIYFATKDTVKEVVDASKTRLVEPETLGGRPKVTDPQFTSAVDEMKTTIKSSVPGSTSVVGGIYGDPAKQDLVMIAGASALLADPKKELDDAIKGLGVGLGVKDLKTVDAGPLGGEAKCGDGNAGGVDVAVCLWADRGSLGMVVSYFKSADELQPQFVAMRGEIEKKD
ncbi:hypothetical protein GA0074695_5366 [Micromonospora viridifaciens]|uniref:Flagellar basal body-associated protein FliL n=1 Tax=Micromonospora viridifaciens TaxID=1881 RepID=A0A1C4ZC02_MICVI|nr:hypothetical protein [Micromonospora viridifaciens]SCF30366.1 hypothetical protein GA0074695_5366 [Micromonospora viridifaciens]